MIEDKDRPLNPEKLRYELQEMALSYKGEVIPSGLFGAVIGTMNKYFIDDNYRKVVLWWLFGNVLIPEPLSSKKLNNGEKYSLIKWVNYEHGYIPSKYFVQEAFEVLIKAVKAYDKLTGNDETICMVKLSQKLGGEITDISYVRSEKACLI